MATFNIGIDPGLKGGIAIVGTNCGNVCFGQTEVHPMPIRGTGPGGVIDTRALIELLPNSIPFSIVYIETQRVIKKQGATSALTIGTNYGRILGALECSGYAYQEVAPSAWKRRASLYGKGKADSVELAVRLYPALADQLRYKLAKELKVIEGQAEALLIQHFGETQ